MLCRTLENYFFPIKIKNIYCIYMYFILSRNSFSFQSCLSSSKHWITCPLSQILQISRAPPAGIRIVLKNRLYGNIKYVRSKNKYKNLWNIYAHFDVMVAQKGNIPFKLYRDFSYIHERQISCYISILEKV